MEENRKFPQSEAQDLQPRKEVSSPLRLRVAMEALIKTGVGKVEREGIDNIQKAKELSVQTGRPVEIVATHFTDLDIPLAVKALAGDFDLAIADISEHRKPSQDPGTFLGLLAAGSSNFHAVDYKRNDENRWQPESFNPANYEPMIEAMSKGKSEVFAAFNPLTADDPRELPRVAGVGAAYLAIKSGAIVLPVSVHVEGKGQTGMAGRRGILDTLRSRPNAKVVIGEPLDLGRANLDVMYKVLHEREEKQKIREVYEKSGVDQAEISDEEKATEKEMSRIEFEAFTVAAKTVKEGSRKIMEALAKVTPVEKGGQWGHDQSEVNISDL